MMKAMLALIALLGAPGTAAALPPQSVPVLPYGVQFELASASTGRTYRIYAHVPSSTPPPAGYPVITFTDGNVTFPTAAIAALSQEISGGTPVLVVAVGYPVDDIKRLSIVRNRDLTPSQPPGTIRQYPGYPTITADDFGHSEEFFRFLTTELRPLLARMYRIDPARQTLAGHSLGGVFTLGVMIHHTAAFSNYVAMSPSIWWHDRAILSDEAGFVREVEAGRAAPRLLITAGGLEDAVPAVLPPALPAGVTRESLIASTALNGIIANARPFAERLSKVSGAPGYAVRFTLIDGEDHNSVIPAAVVKAIRFAGDR